MENFSKWHVLCVSAGRDAIIAQRLTENGFDVYSPLGRRVIIHKRFKTRITKDFTLFPGYLFVTGEDLPVAVATVGVFGFLGLEDCPSVVTMGYVERLRHEEEIGTFDLSGKLNEGRKVSVEIFGEKFGAEIIRSSEGKINAIVEYMGKMIKVMDCATQISLKPA